ncbi:PaaI family thioesterase [Nocardia barduliensis]|uniref:PaaI family thioesterase n=1 Tax=Nocardia barduliensis TaxID=2736643 RepID=UPI001C2D02C6|nr:PaaI family thioesterase [Nocardia barduliensis]
MTQSGTNDTTSSAGSAAVAGDDPSSPLHSPRSPAGVRLCYGCAPRNECRLGVEREQLHDDGVVVSHVVCPESHEGGPGVAHGGWTAGVMDELVGHRMMLKHEFAVTGTLTVKFVRPVPVGWTLIGRAWTVRTENRKVFVRATLQLESSGAVLAEAEAIMIKRPDTHFEQHEQWLQSQRGDR